MTMHTFNINHVLDDGKELTGTFSVKKQSIMDRTRISRRKTELCGGMFCVKNDKDEPTGQGIDEATESINYAIATLEVVIKQAPMWWNLEELSDFELVFKVFGEVRKFEESFRRRGGATSSSDVNGTSSQETSSAQPSATQPDNQPKKVVGGEVLAALDA